MKPEDTELEQEQLEDEAVTDDEDEQEEEQAEETEDSDKAEDSEDSDSEEEKLEEAEDKPKENLKVEKRIASLTAKLKSKDEELAEARERIADLEKNVEDERQRVMEKLPAYEINRKSIYEMTPEEFDDAIDFIYGLDEISTEEKKERVKLAREARKDYFQRIQPVEAENSEVAKEAGVIWQKDWETVEAELVEMYPDVQKEIPRITAYIEKELKRRPLLVKRLRENLVQKFKYTLGVLKELGIDKQLEKEEYAKDTAPGMSAGKGKASPSIKKTPTFTRAQIAKMSYKEFDKWEAAIDKAAKEGRIK